MSTVQTASEQFPSMDDPPSPTSPRRTDSENNPNGSRDSTNTSFQSRLRAASKTFTESNPPTGMWIATGQIASSIPSISDVRRGSYGSDGWSVKGQAIERERRASISRTASGTSEDQTRRRGSTIPSSPKVGQSGQGVRHHRLPEVEEPEQQDLGIVRSGTATTGLSDNITKEIQVANIDSKLSADGSSAGRSTSPFTSDAKVDFRHRTTPFDNGYQFPPKHSWGDATKIFFVAAWKFVTTPIGFLVTIYGLNVVAWGGMLFLLLCNASPAMCTPTCNDINSPRRIWIEIDSQILNALFCVTGFGTIPWRFRDLYYLLQYRVQKKERGLRRLAGINRGWFRLAGSQNLPVALGPAEIEAEIGSVPESCVPFPISKIANVPLTGIRASPTPLWKLDFVVWTMVWNTFLQAVLSGFMWALNRYNRPSWSTGLFVALACIVAACGGIMSFIEGKKVKGIEGVPVSQKDLEQLKKDKELGIHHWNNIKDEKPKEPKEKKAHEGQGLFKRGHKHAEKAQDEERGI
jgi:hypothetical protein